MIKNFKYKLILGSKSPRRKEILREAGFQFETKLKEVDESYDPDMKINEVAEFLACKKAKAMKAELQENELLITADTVVIVNDQIFGKPADYQEAFSMLEDITNAKSHLVITGVCLMTLEKQVSFSEQSEVFFEALNKDEIDYYIKNYQPFDKAGGYGIQEWVGLCKIKKIIGTYSNIKGLPMHAVYKNLMAFS